jgi:multidrug resistance efflux pump
MSSTCVENSIEPGEPLLVSAASDWQCEPIGSQSHDEARSACAALELVESICRADTVEAATGVLVDSLRSFLSAEGAVLGLVQQGRCRLVASAGVAEIHPASELSTAFTHALNNAVELDGRAERPANLGGHELSQARDGLAKLLGGATVHHVVLRNEDAPPLGAIVIWARDTGFDWSLALRFLNFAGQPIASALALVQRRAPRRGLQRFAHALSARWWALFGGLFLTAAVLSFLTPYRVTCDCAAEPFKRRFVAAPFDGVFEKSLVRPGDAVGHNQLLGQMDGRELRLKLATLTADHERVRKSCDINLAAGKVAAAQMDKLDLERLELERQLLEGRMANLDIRSPVDGFVISGDLKRTEGAPLSTGQVLYEIAPLNAMTVEVAIDDDEIAHVAVGQTVSVQFDACPGDPFSGRLARIHPRSETRDSRNVFIGEVLIEGAEGALRPGMKGTARITIDRETLAAGWIKRAWHAVSIHLGI